MRIIRDCLLLALLLAWPPTAVYGLPEEKTLPAVAEEELDDVPHGTGRSLLQFCPAGMATCATGGTCQTAILTDPTNCGSCNRKCSSRNTAAPAKCVNGRCVISCKPNYYDDDDDSTLPKPNGCEIYTLFLLKDPDNCGLVGRKCSAANAEKVACVDGVCVPTCYLGFIDMNGDANPDRVPVPDGCERNLGTDVNNCGAIGRVCTSSDYGTYASCVGGQCRLVACASGYGNCNRNNVDLCETRVYGSDSMNCGACGHQCRLPNANTYCLNGFCKLSSCSPNYCNSNGVETDGCEAFSKGSDVKNCGGCNVVCAASRANTYCSLGVCNIGSCTDGYLNCDGSVANGCEVDGKDDTHNCGKCKWDCTKVLDLSNWDKLLGRHRICKNSKCIID